MAAPHPIAHLTAEDMFALSQTILRRAGQPSALVPERLGATVRALRDEAAG